jgi:hypothetical protein
MDTTITNATEYRNLPLAMLTESTTNPRRIFEESALKEFASFVPWHIIGILWRSPFCGIGREETNGSWRSTFRREHNG